MRVLITGGSGLIGRALTNSFLADGHEVVIVSRQLEPVKGFPPNVLKTGWDKDSLIKSLDGADVVINLAGASIAGETPLKMRWTPKRKKQILESRVVSGERLTEAVQSVQTKPRVLVQSSAVGFYGPQADELIDESSPAGNDFLARVTQEWENSTKSIESLGVRRVVIRTGLVFSKRGGIFPLLKLPFSFFFGGPLGNGQQYLSWIHVDDVVKGIRYLIDNEGTQGVYNLSSPNPVTNKEFSKTIGKAMKRPSFVPVPTFAMKLALGESATLALDGQQVIPKRLLGSGFVFKYKTLEEALSSLLEPTKNFKQ